MSRALSIGGAIALVVVGFVAWLTYADAPDFATVRARGSRRRRICSIDTAW